MDKETSTLTGPPAEGTLAPNSLSVWDCLVSALSLCMPCISSILMKPFSSLSKDPLGTQEAYLCVTSEPSNGASGLGWGGQFAELNLGQ